MWEPQLGCRDGRQTQETWKQGWEAVGMMGGRSENFGQEHLHSFEPSREAEPDTSG